MNIPIISAKSPNFATVNDFAMKGTTNNSYYLTMAVLAALLLTACGNSGTPLDADTREQIDSITTARIRIARDSLDSLCEIQHTTVLPRLVDSIKQKRLKEIAEKLKTVPK